MQIITDDIKVLHGTITNITYQSEDNSFNVFIMKCANSDSNKGYSYITCVGEVINIHKGLILNLFGEFTNNNRYGKQFKFKSYEHCEPIFEEEIITYLSSGIIEEVDYITAQKIYNQFKEETIKILDREPERLLEVRGIGKYKYNVIINSWQEYRENLNIYILMQSHGISNKIIEQLKLRASKNRMTIKNLILKKNYGLIYHQHIKFIKDHNFAMHTIDDGFDITFNEIDCILKNIAPDKFKELEYSFNRICAAIYSYIENSNYRDGSVCRRYNEVLQNLSKILSINYETLNTIFIENYNNNYELYNIYLETNIKNDDIIDDIGYLYNYDTYYNEQYITKFINDNKDNIQDLSHLYNDEMLDIIQEHLDIKYNEDQCNAIKNCLTNPITIITGGPGTGKTTIVKSLIYLFEKYRREHLVGRDNGYDKVLLLAPTGKAVRRLMDVTEHGAMTIHMAIYCQPHVIESTSCIIIDEASMIDLSLMAILLMHVKDFTRIIFLGDIHQLPSISPGNVLKDLINSKRIPTITLNHIYRQEHGYIISNAHDINNGIIPSLNNSDSTDFYYIDTERCNYSTQEILMKLIKDILPNVINNNDIERELQILTPMKKYDNGVIAINQFMQNYYEETHKKLHETIRRKENSILDKYLYKFSINYKNSRFNVGDRIIYIVNDYDKKIFNGETGIIQYIKLNEELEFNIRESFKKRKNKTIKHNFKDSDYDIHIAFNDNYEYCKVIPYSDLDNLQLAYAITVHKSQGSEYNYVIVFLNSNHGIMLQRNLLYTAITRTKNKLFLISDDNTITKAIMNNKVEKRLTLLKERLVNSNDKC